MTMVCGYSMEVELLAINAERKEQREHGAGGQRRVVWATVDVGSQRDQLMRIHGHLALRLVVYCVSRAVLMASHSIKPWTSIVYKQHRALEPHIAVRAAFVTLMSVYQDCFTILLLSAIVFANAVKHNET